MGHIVPDISRRAVMGGTVMLLPLPASAQIAAAREIRALEKSSGARIGLAAVDTGNARCLFNRESERFMMCSSFKLSLAAAVLARADKGAEHLDRVIHYSKEKLLPVSPATTRNLTTGMTIRDLCEAICIYSDNAGANLLLAEIGGPHS